MLLKYPVEVWRESSAYQKPTDEIANNISVERQILDLLESIPELSGYSSQSPLAVLPVLLTLLLDALDGKTAREGYSLLRRATAVFSGISTRTTTLSICPSARNGVGKLSNQSHTVIVVV